MADNMYIISSTHVDISTTSGEKVTVMAERVRSNKFASAGVLLTPHCRAQELLLEPPLN